MKNKALKALAVLIVVGSFAGWFAWFKFFREVPQPPFASEEMRFKYGSLGSENDRGVPFWIWVVLPRVFPDLLPGPGGYRSFGVVWEEGEEIPVGFTRKTVGFPRIANNCAICHAATYRTRPDEAPRLVVAGPAHTTNVQQMIRFLAAAANDPRFNAGELMPHIEREIRLSWTDRLLYRFVIIPFTRRALRQQGRQFAWMDRPGKPDWGCGRDDPMNLTKYFMTSMKEDESVGQADFPSIWNLQVRKGDGLYLNWSGDTPAVRSVLIDSALGLGARPTAWFLHRMEELDNYLSALPAPKWPSEFPLDANRAAAGRRVYAEQCASCHDPGAPRTNKVIPLEEIGTDRERMDTWTQQAADEANRRVKEIGIDRPGMVKQSGYLSPPLDGLWLRAPYLHNGSVPNLRELLEPEERRTKVFYRGYDVYDPVNGGFVTAGPEAERAGSRLDTSERGNSNRGHRYGTTLSPQDKEALLEYLKTL